MDSTLKIAMCPDYATTQDCTPRLGRLRTALTDLLVFVRNMDEEANNIQSDIRILLRRLGLDEQGGL